MTCLVKLTIFASALALALAGLGASSFALADKLPRQCIDCVPGGNGGPPGGGNDQNEENQGRHHQQQGQPNGDNGPDQDNAQRWHKYHPDNQPGADNNGPDQGMPNRHSRKYHPNDQFQQGGGGDGGMDQQRHADNHKWHYDPHHHQRRNHRDSHFRFYFGGFWYPEPYWDEPDYYYDDYSDPYGVSCREGADIVAERFARVRVLDCNGRVYTYLGRRYGMTYEIVVSPRTGRILDAHEI